MQRVIGMDIHRTFAEVVGRQTEVLQHLEEAERQGRRKSAGTRPRCIACTASASLHPELSLRQKVASTERSL